MGKYMKKSKIAGDIAVMEVSHHQSAIGSRTRAAKTLALQRLQKSPSPSSPDVSSSLSYLQLRSRRLEKFPSPVFPETKQKQQQGGKKDNDNKKTKTKTKSAVASPGGDNNNNNNYILDFQSNDRSTRESTPCSLVKDSEVVVATPCSATRRRSYPSSHRFFPTTHEMDEFFAGAEQEQQQLFAERYNFDIVNDLPLPGRYEWVQVFP